MMPGNRWSVAAPAGFPLAVDAPGGFPVALDALVAWARRAVLPITTADAMGIAKLGVDAPARLVIPVGTNKYATSV